MSSSLVKLLNTHFPAFTSQPKLDRSNSAEAVLLFMFRGLTSGGLSKALKPMGGNVKEFRMSLRGDGYLFSIKACIYYLFYHGVNARTKRYERVLKHFQIREEDRPLIAFAMRSSKLLRVMKRYKRRFPAYRLTDFRSLLDTISVEVQVSAAKYTRKKMSFISRATGLGIHDLSTDLVLHGLSAVMQMYPRLISPLHAQNIAKTAIHNEGVNAIHYYTTMGRGTLVRENDGTFSSKKVSYDTLIGDGRVQNVGVGSSSTSGFSGNSLGEVLEERDVLNDQITGQQLLKKYDGKKGQLLRLMCGEPDAGFTHYLRSRKLIKRAADNEDFYVEKAKETAGMDAYIHEAITYLNCNEVKALRFIGRLRQQLGGKRV